MSLSLPPLYAILDPEHTKGRAIEEVLRELLRAGIKMLQLRAKSLAAKDFLALAKLVRSETESHNCRLIVNDRADIAMACDADGLHLGQDDLPLQAGRKLLGNKIIGISTHDIEQALQAQRSGADYIGFGPMFGTQTKDTGYGARGTDMLKEIRARGDHSHSRHRRYHRTQRQPSLASRCGLGGDHQRYPGRCRHRRENHTNYATTLSPRFRLEK